jgi:hypothetical protein
MAAALERAASCTVFIGKETPQGWFKGEIHKALSRRMRDSTRRPAGAAAPPERRAHQACRGAARGAGVRLER